MPLPTRWKKMSLIVNGVSHACLPKGKCSFGRCSQYPPHFTAIKKEEEEEIQQEGGLYLGMKWGKHSRSSNLFPFFFFYLNISFLPEWNHQKPIKTPAQVRRWTWVLRAAKCSELQVRAPESNRQASRCSESSQDRQARRQAGPPSAQPR